MVTPTRIVAIVLAGIGAGMLVYGMKTDDMTFRAPFGWRWLWSTPAEVSAWGAGALVAGVLLLSFVPRAATKPI